MSAYFKKLTEKVDIIVPEKNSYRVRSRPGARVKAGAGMTGIQLKNQKRVGGAWYAVNTNPRCERLVRDLLERESFQVFLPETAPAKTGRDRPLFPGYLFVRVDAKSADWAKIRYLHGVRKLIGFGNTPVPVPEGVLNAILRALEAGGYARRALGLIKGDQVRFKAGPFSGLEARFTGEASGRERVKVLLEALQRPFVVEVDAAELSKVG